MIPPSATASFPGGLSTFHPSLGQVRYEVREINNDTPDDQVASTVSLMRQYCQQDLNEPLALPAIQEDVRSAWQSTEPLGDTWAYLHRDGARGMRFVRDEETFLPFADYEFSIPGRWRPMVESLAHPEMLVRSTDPQGDCDDFCSYGATHLLLRGVPCSFVTVAADSSDPSIYSHVYLVAYPSSGPYAGRRIPLDLSHGKYPGWEVENVYRRKEWAVAGGTSPLCVFAALGIGAAAIYAATRGRRAA